MQPLAFFHHLAGYLAADIGNLALQVADARFACVAADDAHNGFVGKGQVLRPQPCRVPLLAHQEALGDFQLLWLRVARQAQALHAVLQRLGDRMGHVSGGDEEDLREVVLDVQVVVHEHVVLLGVEHFQQRGRGIAAEVHAHLVHFIEQEDGVDSAGLLHHLDDLARQGADIGAPVAADLRLVAHPAQRQPYELAARSAGNRSAQRGLAHPGWPDEAQNRALGVLHQLPNGQELQNPLLNLFQPIVVFFENLLGPLEVAVFLGSLLPGHGEQPIEVIARHGGFGRHGGHHFEALEFGLGLVAGVLGHARGFDLLLQLVSLVLLVAPQLFLDGPNLLVQVILALRPLHLTLDAALDGPVHVELLDFDVQDVGQARQPVHGVENLQQFLPLLDADAQVGRDGVGELPDLVHLDGGDHRFVVQALGQFHVLLEQRSHPLDEQFQAGGRHGAVGRRFHRRPEVAFLGRDLQDLAALDAFHQHLDIPVGQFQALHDIGDGPDLVNLVGLGLIHGGVVLRGQENPLVAGQRFFQRPDGRLAADHEGRHHVRKDDDVPDGHHGQRPGIRFLAA